jgi:AcrR family transcriptional regulator
VAERSAKSKPVGRPSLADERRGQLIEAAIDLIAERGLASLTLDDVAAVAGVQRTVIRHYVGNRSDVLRAVADELISRYTTSIRAAVGTAPSVRAIVSHLFSTAWSTARARDDRALDELFREAARDDDTRARLAGAYQLLIDEIAGSIVREREGVQRTAAVDAAYQIVALAESNATLQQLGFPAARASAARRAAFDIVDRL